MVDAEISSFEAARQARLRVGKVRKQREFVRRCGLKYLQSGCCGEVMADDTAVNAILD